MFNCNKIQYPKEVPSVIFWKHLSLPTPFIFVKSEAKERERAFKGFSKRREKKGAQETPRGLRVQEAKIQGKSL